MQYVKTLAVVVVSVAVVDLCGALAWIASGQVPHDSYYVGALTHYVLTLAL